MPKLKKKSHLSAPTLESCRVQRLYTAMTGINESILWSYDIESCII